MRRGAILVASYLLLFAILVNGWDWWHRHDIEVLGILRHAPGLGASLDVALGVDARRDEVRIAVDASYPPFASVDPDGRLVGFEVDLSEELGRRIAATPRIINMDAGDALFDALAAQKIDAIVAGLTYHPDVTRDVAFSRSYFEAGPVVFARAGDHRIQDTDDLGGKRVAVEIGSLGEQEARRIGKQVSRMELVLLADVHRVVQALVAGEVDAAVLDRPSIPVDSPELGNLSFVAGPLVSQPYVVATRRKDTALMLAINRELEAMTSSGALLEIERRWFP